MPGVFLSHSSRDRDFVQRLAADLAGRGLPVWLDTWELSPGDTLDERIAAGLDASACVVLVVSRHTAGSTWVAREVESALAREGRERRRLVFPIRIDDAALPDAVAARVHIDFGAGYLTGFEPLAEALERAGALAEGATLAGQAVPLQITHGLYVNEGKLERVLRRLAGQRREGERFEASQFLVLDDPGHAAVRRGFAALIDGYPASPGYSADVESELTRIYDSVRDYERRLPQGVAAIADALVTPALVDGAVQATHWYVRLMRSIALHRMLVGYAMAHTEPPPVAVPVHGHPMMDERQAAAFFGVAAVGLHDVFDTRGNAYFKAWVDRDSEVGRWFAEFPYVHRTVAYFWSGTLIYRCLVPQMVQQHGLDPSVPLTWDFAGWNIGLA